MECLKQKNTASTVSWVLASLSAGEIEAAQPGSGQDIAPQEKGLENFSFLVHCSHNKAWSMPAVHRLDSVQGLK